MSEEGERRADDLFDELEARSPAKPKPPVLLCLSYSSNRIGAAWYEMESQSVYVVQDVDEDQEFHYTRSLFTQCQPTVVLANKQQDLQLLGQDPTLGPVDNLALDLSQLSSQDGGEEQSSQVSSKDQSTSANNGHGQKQEEMENDEDEVTHATQESQTPWANESYDAFWKNAGFEDVPSQKSEQQSLRTFSQLLPPGTEEELREEPADLGLQGEEPKPLIHILPAVVYRFEEAKIRLLELFDCDMLGLQFRVDMNSVNMIRAFGALLKYMDSTRVGVEFEPFDVKTPVRAVRTTAIQELVEVDDTTLRALEIFAVEQKKDLGYRSLKRKGSFRPSERVSVFSLCNRCRSGPGKLMLRKWFAHPTLDRATLLKRQEAVSFFAQDCNLDVAHYIYSNLKQIKNCVSLLRRIKSGQAKQTDWRHLYETCLCCVRIATYLNERDIKLDLIGLVNEVFDKHLFDVTTLLNSVVDLEASRADGGLVVNRGVDTSLDSLRDQLDKLPDLLTRAALSEAERLNLKRCQVHYLPMIGYLLSLPVDDFQAFDGHPDLEFVYGKDDEVCCKTMGMRQLDESLGDIRMQIIDKETTVQLRLQGYTLSRAESLLRAVRAVASVDAVLALAKTARELNWKRPMLVDDSRIEIDGGRHPLVEVLSNRPFVANPMHSTPDSSRMKILTGPNACGKSIYLKQVGVIVYLTLVGSFVPADKAIVGPVNRILTRMWTLEVVLDGMSTFAKDLDQLTAALRRGTVNSLIMIDEFGKGTMTEVGISLLAAALNFWLRKGTGGCPHVLVSSHFHSLPEFLVNKELFELLVRHRLGRLDFLYRLVPGTMDCSFATNAARIAGIPEDVVKRAVEVYGFLRSGQSLHELPPKDGTEAEQRNAKMEKCVQPIVDDFLEWDLDKDPEGFLELAKKAFARVESEKEVKESVATSHEKLGVKEAEHKEGLQEVEKEQSSAEIEKMEEESRKAENYKIEESGESSSGEDEDEVEDEEEDEEEEKNEEGTEVFKNENDNLLCTLEQPQSSPFLPCFLDQSHESSIISGILKTGSSSKKSSSRSGAVTVSFAAEVQTRLVERSGFNSAEPAPKKPKREKFSAGESTILKMLTGTCHSFSTSRSSSFVPPLKKKGKEEDSKVDESENPNLKLIGLMNRPMKSAVVERVKREDVED